MATAVSFSPLSRSIPPEIKRGRTRRWSCTVKPFISASEYDSFKDRDGLVWSCGSRWRLIGWLSYSSDVRCGFSQLSAYASLFRTSCCATLGVWKFEHSWRWPTFCASLCVLNSRNGVIFMWLLETCRPEQFPWESSSRIIPFFLLSPLGYRRG